MDIPEASSTNSFLHIHIHIIIVQIIKDLFEFKGIEAVYIILFCFTSPSPCEIFVFFNTFGGNVFYVNVKWKFSIWIKYAKKKQ